MSTSDHPKSVPCSLFTKTRQAILALFFTGVNEQYYFREIVRITGVGHGATERELQNLSVTGIIIREKRGNMVFFKLNPDCPIQEELKSIFIKTFGVCDVLKTALMPLEKKIGFAFIYGSFATGSYTQSSDIDLMLIGDISHIDAVRALAKAQTKLNREINPSVFSISEFTNRVRSQDSFMLNVIKKEKIMIFGDGNELELLGRTAFHREDRNRPASDRKSSLKRKAKHR